MQPNKPKRLIIEEAEMAKNPIEGVTILPDETDFLRWKIFITGPKGTPYEGGVFQLSCQFPENYPFKTPDLKFDTKIYHPYVSSYGDFKQEFYQTDWVPTRKLAGVIRCLIQGIFLNAPNEENGIFLESAIMNEYTRNLPQFNKTAAEWTRKYASPGN